MPVNQLYLQNSKMPFVRLLLPFVAGITAEWYLQCSFFLFVPVFVCALIGYQSFRFLSLYQRFKWQYQQGMAVMVMLFCAGAMVCYCNNPAHQFNRFESVYKPGDVIVATIDEVPLPKSHYYKANVSVNGVVHAGHFQQAGGKLLVYFSKEKADAGLQYGSQIVFVKSPERVVNSGNPGAFDYKQYLFLQGITSQVFLGANQYHILAQNGGSSLWATLYSLRETILQTIRKYISGKDEQGVAEALLIGYRNDLDKRLLQSYSNTGVVHIIAISGLHLGMIYGLILLIASPFKHRKSYRFVVPLISISVLWGFALMAGGAPSVLRSAVMFTFVAGGTLLNRKNSIYNTLAASAFCLLLYNPFLLWDVGFQLSYTAVTGISLFTRPISGLLYVQNSFLQKIWLAVCVTLSAQIFTLPIVLYQFHQFPLIVLFTNLVIVVLSQIILFLLLLLAFAGGWVAVASLIGTVLSILLSGMNNIIRFSEKVSSGLLLHFSINSLQAWLLYLFIILISVWLFYRLSQTLLYALSLFAVLLLISCVSVYQSSQQHKLVVYNVPKQSALDIVSGRTALCFSDSVARHDANTSAYTLTPAHSYFNINRLQENSLDSSVNLFFHTNGKTILYLNDASAIVPVKTNLQADVVILSGNPKLYMDDVLQTINCSVVVADGTNANYKLKYWEQDCAKRGIRFYSVAQQGAFIMDL